MVAGSGSAGATGAKTSDYWDFTVPGSTWQLCSKSCSFLSYATSSSRKQYSNLSNKKSCSVHHKTKMKLYVFVLFASDLEFFC